MDPVTHFMTGGCLARAGFNRTTRYATLVMVLAAEAPDLDTLWGIRGPLASFQHHRGWTHTFLGLPLDAAIVLAAVWLFHRLRRHRPERPGTLPVRWPQLFLLALVALLSHLLLDWTNNYGIRPFFPFNPRWYAGSFVFIVEPVMLLLLAVGLLAPSLFGLISSEVGARRQPFSGRGWAASALAGIVLLYGLRLYEKSAAEDLALAANLTPSAPTRTTACPFPINPFRWHVILDTPSLYQTATVDTLQNQVSATPQRDLIYKPAETPATLAAKQSRLGRVYLDWSSFPLITTTHLSSGTDPTQSAASDVVTFSDMRFRYDTLAFHGTDAPPLSGQVALSPAHTVVALSFDGHPVP